MGLYQGVEWMVAGAHVDELQRLAHRDRLASLVERCRRHRVRAALRAFVALPGRLQLGSASPRACTTC